MIKIRIPRGPTSTHYENLSSAIHFNEVHIIHKFNGFQERLLQVAGESFYNFALLVCNDVNDKINFGKLSCFSHIPMHWVVFQVSRSRICMQQHRMVLLDGFFAAHCGQNAFSSAAIPSVIVKADIAQKHSYICICKDTVNHNFIAMCLCCANIHQMGRSTVMAHNFNPFQSVRTNQSFGFLRFNRSVSAATKNNRDIFVFDPGDAQLGEHGQKHRFGWRFAGYIINNDCDFAFRFGDFAKPH